MKRLLFLLFVLPIFCFGQAIPQQHKTPASGTNAGNQYYTWWGMQAQGYFIPPFGTNATLNRATDMDGLVYFQLSDHTIRMRLSGVWVSFGGGGSSTDTLYFNPDNFYKDGKTDSTAISIRWLNTPDGNLGVDSSVVIRPDGTPGKVLIQSFNSQNGIISGLESSLFINAPDTSLAIAPGAWRINNVVFTTDTTKYGLLPPRDPTNSVYVVAYGDNTGTINFITGTASVNPVVPSIPSGTVYIGQALVQPNGYLVGGNYLPAVWNGSNQYLTQRNLNGHLNWTLSNPSNGNDASSSFRAANDLGQFVGGNITSSGYATSGTLSNPDRAYFTTTAPWFGIGAQQANSVVLFYAGGFSPSSVALKIDSIQNVHIYKTPQGLSTDSLLVKDGNTIKAIVPTSIFSFTNGLTLNPGANVQLGGTITGSGVLLTIPTASTNSFVVTGGSSSPSATGTFKVNQNQVSLSSTVSTTNNASIATKSISGPNRAQVILSVTGSGSNITSVTMNATGGGILVSDAIGGLGYKYTTASDYANQGTDTLTIPPRGWIQRYVAASATGAIDTTIIRTVANSYSLAGMQTKLNGYVPTSRTIAGFALSSNVSLGTLTATDATLTFSGTYDGSTNRTVGINLANANTWTGTQTINKLNIGATANQSAWGNNTNSSATGASFTEAPFTYTDNTTAASTTYTFGFANVFQQPTFAASNNMTYTNTATVAIVNSPTVSSSGGGTVTNSNPIALYVINGSTVLNGGIFSGTGGVSNNFSAAGGSGALGTTDANYLPSGATGLFYREAVRGSTSTSITSGYSATALAIGATVYTTANSSITPMVASVFVRGPSTITLGSSATVTKTASLWLDANTSTTGGSNWTLVALGQNQVNSLVFGSTTAAINTSATVTAAQLAGGTLTSTSAAGVTMTLPLATAFATQIAAVQGTSFEFVVDNSAGANTVTVATNTGFSAASVITGGTTLTVNSGTIGTFRIYYESSSTAILSRIQ